MRCSSVRLKSITVHALWARDVLEAASAMGLSLRQAQDMLREKANRSVQRFKKGRTPNASS